MNTRKTAMILVAIIMMFAFVSNAHAQTVVYARRVGTGIKTDWGSVNNGQKAYVEGVANDRNMRNKTESYNNYTTVDEEVEVDIGNAKIIIKTKVTVPSGSYVIHNKKRYKNSLLLESNRIRVYNSHTYTNTWSY